MPKIEVSLSDDVHFQFERMVDEEFVTEEQAVEELLTAGLEAYNATSGPVDDRSGFEEGIEGNLFDTDEGDPSERDTL
jgi:hypothetical protein